MLQYKWGSQMKYWERNPDTKAITPFTRLSKLAKGERGAIYVLEVVYPGGELIYHQTNSTLNS